MKSILSVIFMSVVIGSGFTGCKGKTGPEGVQGPIGPTGPLGPGPTEYIYTGNFPVDIEDNGRYLVNIPEMNNYSEFVINISSNSINWQRTLVYSLDLTNKNVDFQVRPGQQGWYYGILMQN